MKLDGLFSGKPGAAVAAAAGLEKMGLQGMWSFDTAHNPFYPLLLGAEHTSRITLGTGIAVALARSPMTLAQEAWDLADLSKGRFVLGIGSQIEAHIVKRFSMPWHSPVEQMRDMVGALRAIWNAFQTGDRLRYEGRYYRHTLLTPFFSPGPIDHPDIPIIVAGVGPQMTTMAAECADGFMLHAFTTARYFDKVTAPAIADGLARSGRSRGDFTVVAPLFVITGNEEQQARLAKEVRKQIAFYGSTPAYHPVLDDLGLGDLGKTLNRLSKAGEWAAMGALISDDLVDEFAVRAPFEQLPAAIIARWGGKADRLIAQFPLPAENADAIRACVDALGHV